jgi:hypothetical protein
VCLSRLDFWHEVDCGPGDIGLVEPDELDEH